jgi:ribosome-binding protein aMBF1 (putative translation factor)
MPEKTRPCEICGQPIDPERIEVVPETRLCVEHARMIGQYGGEFLVTGTQASLGRSGSLKKNYGDVSIDKKRNTEAPRKLREAYDQRRERETGPSGGAAR